MTKIFTPGFYQDITDFFPTEYAAILHHEISLLTLFSKIQTIDPISDETFEALKKTSNSLLAKLGIDIKRIKNKEKLIEAIQSLVNDFLEKTLLKVTVSHEFKKAKQQFQEFGQLEDVKNVLAFFNKIQGAQTPTITKISLLKIIHERNKNLLQEIIFYRTEIENLIKLKAKQKNLTPEEEKLIDWISNFENTFYLKNTWLISYRQSERRNLLNLLSQLPFDSQVRINFLAILNPAGSDQKTPILTRTKSVSIKRPLERAIDSLRETEKKLIFYKSSYESDQDLEVEFEALTRLISQSNSSQVDLNFKTTTLSQANSKVKEIQNKITQHALQEIQVLQNFYQEWKVDPEHKEVNGVRQALKTLNDLIIKKRINKSNFSLSVYENLRKKLVTSFSGIDSSSRVRRYFFKILNSSKADLVSLLQEYKKEMEKVHLEEKEAKLEAILHAAANQEYLEKKAQFELMSPFYKKVEAKEIPLKTIIELPKHEYKETKSFLKIAPHFSDFESYQTHKPEIISTLEKMEQIKYKWEENYRERYHELSLEYQELYSETINPSLTENFEQALRDGNVPMINSILYIVTNYIDEAEKVKEEKTQRIVLEIGFKNFIFYNHGISFDRIEKLISTVKEYPELKNEEKAIESFEKRIADLKEEIRQSEIQIRNQNLEMTSENLQGKLDKSAEDKTLFTHRFSEIERDFNSIITKKLTDIFESKKAELIQNLTELSKNAAELVLNALNYQNKFNDPEVKKTLPDMVKKVQTQMDGLKEKIQEKNNYVLTLSLDVETKKNRNSSQTSSVDSNKFKSIKKERGSSSPETSPSTPPSTSTYEISQILESLSRPPLVEFEVFESYSPSSSDQSLLDSRSLSEEPLSSTPPSLPIQIPQQSLRINSSGVGGEGYILLNGVATDVHRNYFPEIQPVAEIYQPRGYSPSSSSFVEIESDDGASELLSDPVSTPPRESKEDQQAAESLSVKEIHGKIEALEKAKIEVADLSKEFIQHKKEFEETLSQHSLTFSILKILNNINTYAGSRLIAYNSNRTKTVDKRTKLSAIVTDLKHLINTARGEEQKQFEQKLNSLKRSFLEFVNIASRDELASTALSFISKTRIGHYLSYTANDQAFITFVTDSFKLIDNQLFTNPNPDPNSLQGLKKEFEEVKNLLNEHKRPPLAQVILSLKNETGLRIAKYRSNFDKTRNKRDRAQRIFQNLETLHKIVINESKEDFQQHLNALKDEIHRFTPTAITPVTFFGSNNTDNDYGYIARLHQDLAQIEEDAIQNNFIVRQQFQLLVA